MSLPRSWRLPWGWTIQILTVSAAEMLESVPEDDPANVADGAWLVDEKKILIRKGLPVRRQRYILTHEMHHALLDWEHAMLNEGKAKT